MKVAFFIGSLSRGGTETLVLDTFRRRDVAPFECILIYRNEGDLSEDYRATGVPMFRIKPSRFKIGYVSKLRRLLKREGVDILHTQTLWNGLPGILCTCFSKVKLVASFHGFLSTTKNKLFAHLVIWCADTSIFVSDYERKWYLNQILFAPEKRCKVVYNGIDFSKFDIESPDSFWEEKKDLNLPGNVRMAMVGNFVRGRSQLFLCHALKELKNRGACDFRFYFIGKRSPVEPGRFDNCVRYCQENGLLDSSVFFLGGRNDVPSILKHMDAFVYSSDCDTFGLAVVEAMASGIPVVVNDWEVMREITDNGNLATLYKTRDVNDCASKMEDVSNHLQDRRSAAKRVAEVIRGRFGIENHILNLYKAYKATLI